MKVLATFTSQLMSNHITENHITKFPLKLMVISSFPKCDIVKLSLHSVDGVENLLLQMKIFWVNEHPILIQIVIKFKCKFVSLNVLWSIGHQNVLQLTTVS